jgi:hypothetical protein
MNAPTLRPSHTAGFRRQRAASLKTVWRHRLSGFATRVWSVLEDTARLHAASELLREASRLQATDPGVAASLRALALVPQQTKPRADTLARAA